MPADFFRTMEDASGVDLDWFWRGWFYSTDHVDLAIRGVRRLGVQQGPEVEKQAQRAEREEKPETQSEEKNKSLPKYVDKFPELKDFYNDYDPLDVTPKESRAYQKFVEKLTEDERKLLDTDHYFYLVDLENVGGLVMPVILELTFEDGSTDELRYPAEIWNKNNESISKLLITDKPVASLKLDPRLETADVDLANNDYPPRIQKSRFELFKESRERPNPMRDQQIELKRTQQQKGGNQ